MLILFGLAASPVVTNDMPPPQVGSAHVDRIEKEMLARIRMRATAARGFRYDSSDFDLRLPLRDDASRELSGA